MKTTIQFAIVLLFSLTVAAQQTKKTKKAPAQKETTGKINSSSFYKTPYNERNSGSFDGSTHLISIAYGIPNTLDYAGFLFGGNDSGIGPIAVRYEHPIREEAGVGLSIAGATKKWEFFDDTSTDVTGISVTPLGFYHFNKLIPVAKLDVYAGVGANVNYIMYSYEGDLAEDDSEVEVLPVGLVGVRYYFTNSFSALAEVGGGSFSILRLGVSFKI